MNWRMMSATKLLSGYCEIQILKFTRAYTSFYEVGDVLFLSARTSFRG